MTLEFVFREREREGEGRREKTEKKFSIKTSLRTGENFESRGGSGTNEAPKERAGKQAARRETYGIPQARSATSEEGRGESGKGVRHRRGGKGQGQKRAGRNEEDVRGVGEKNESRYVI